MRTKTQGDENETEKKTKETKRDHESPRKVIGVCMCGGGRVS